MDERDKAGLGAGRETNFDTDISNWDWICLFSSLSLQASDAASAHGLIPLWMPKQEG